MTLFLSHPVQTKPLHYIANIEQSNAWLGKHCGLITKYQNMEKLTKCLIKYSFMLHLSINGYYGYYGGGNR